MHLAQTKQYVFLFMALLLIACKPTADATAQSISAVAVPAADPAELKVEGSDGAMSEAIRKSGPKGITQDYLDCMDLALGTIERAACISDEKNRQNARLNDRYQQALKLLDEDRKERLIEAQREWLVLREKDGAFEASLFENTQIENLAGAEREMFYVVERADRIQEWLEMTTRFEDQVSTGGVNTSCPEARVLFHCATKNGKKIMLCDRGETLEYSFGETGATPELAFSLPREKATTSQWRGIGRWISYSITLPSGDADYTVFTSVDRLTDQHEFEAGVLVTIGDADVARILCEDPITHNIDGVDLKQEN